MKILHRGNYAERRRTEYPDIRDQLDVMIKTLAALREQGVELPPEASDLIDKCLAVKEKYPKPT